MVKAIQQIEARWLRQCLLFKVVLLALLSVLHFLVTYKMSLHAFLTGIRIEGITCSCTVKINTALDSARNKY